MARQTRFLFAAVSALLALGLGACSGAPAGSGSPAATTAAGSATSFTTIQPGKLTVGVPTFPPFVGIENGKITGVDGEIINAVAEKLGLEVVAEPYEFSALIPALQQKRVDVAIGSVFRTNERAKVVDFTDPLYIEPPGVVSKQGFSSIDQFKSLKVGTIQGYNWVESVQKVLGDNKLTLYPSSTELKADLEAGRIEVGIDSYGTTRYLYAKTDWKTAVLTPDDRIPEATNPGQTAILVSKENPGLAAAINPHIAELHSSGFIAKALENSGLNPLAATTGPPRFL